MGSARLPRRKTAISSAKPLVERLGIQENMTILVANSPNNYMSILGQLPKGVVIATDSSKGPYELIHFFTKARAELEQEFPFLKSQLSPRGALWISWPKGSPGVHTDLNENQVRETGLANGMVDVKVVAVDTIWSGLKFVRRLKEVKTALGYVFKTVTPLGLKDNIWLLNASVLPYMMPYERFFERRSWTKQQSKI